MDIPSSLILSVVSCTYIYKVKEEKEKEEKKKKGSY
jgi:hypothetical protein